MKFHHTRLLIYFVNKRAGLNFFPPYSFILVCSFIRDFKGDIISKCFFGVFNSPKKTTGPLILNIPVQNLRSMGYLAPWLDFHWFNKFYLYVISLIYTTLAFVKKENSKRDIYKLVKPMEVNRTCIAWFQEFSLDVSSLIVTTSAFVKKERSKMRHLKKFVKPMEVKLRSKIDLRFPTGMVLVQV